MLENDSYTRVYLFVYIYMSTYPYIFKHTWYEYIYIHMYIYIYLVSRKLSQRKRKHLYKKMRVDFKRMLVKPPYHSQAGGFNAHAQATAETNLFHSAWAKYEKLPWQNDLYTFGKTCYTLGMMKEMPIWLLHMFDFCVSFALRETQISLEILRTTVELEQGKVVAMSLAILLAQLLSWSHWPIAIWYRNIQDRILPDPIVHGLMQR